MGISKMKAGPSQAPTVHIKKFFAQAKKQVASKKEAKEAKTGSRLYVKGVVCGYRRALTNQKNHISLIRIQGVDDSEDLKFYLGKRIMYMYRADRAERHSIPCDVGQGVCSSRHQRRSSLQVQEQPPLLCSGRPSACHAFPIPCLSVLTPSLVLAT